MKRVVLILSFAGILSAQTHLFQDGYSGIGVAFSRSFGDVPVKSLHLIRTTASNYKIEATLNYAEKNGHEGGLNSVGLDFSRLLYKKNKKLPFSGYGHLGFEFISRQSVYYGVNLGFGIFHNFLWDNFSLVPEFGFSYNFLMNSGNNLNRPFGFGPEQYLNLKKNYLIVFRLNTVIRFSPSKAINIRPALLAAEEGYGFNLQAGFNFGL